jgi:hypothetical protein
MTKKSEIYIEEELLTALLDGELFGERAKEVQRAVFESDDLKFQLRGLGMVSSQFKESYRSELALAWSQGQPDLWNSLKRSIEMDMRSQRSVLPTFNVDFEPVRARFDSFSRFLQRNLMPTVGAFAAACLLVVVGINYLGDRQIESSIVASKSLSNDREILMHDLLSELSSSRGSVPVRDELVGKFGVGRSRPDGSTVHFVSDGHIVGSGGKNELPANLFSEQLIDPNKLSVEPQTSSSKIEWISSDRPFKFIQCRRERSHPPTVWISRNE